MTEYRLVSGVEDHMYVLQLLSHRGLWLTVPQVHFKDLDAGEQKEIKKALEPVGKYLTTKG